MEDYFLKIFTPLRNCNVACSPALRLGGASEQLSGLCLQSHPQPFNQPWPQSALHWRQTCTPPRQIGSVWHVTSERLPMQWRFVSSLLASSFFKIHEIVMPETKSGASGIFIKISQIGVARPLSLPLRPPVRHCDVTQKNLVRGSKSVKRSNVL